MRCSRPCFLRNRNQYKIFGNGAQSDAAVLAGTQNTVSYVLVLRTPLLRQGGMTDFFLSKVFCAICGSSSVLFQESIHCLLQGELLYIYFFPFLRVSILSLARVLVGLFLPLSLIWPNLFRKQEFNPEVFFERRASLGNPHPVSK